MKIHIIRDRYKIDKYYETVCGKMRHRGITMVKRADISKITCRECLRIHTQEMIYGVSNDFLLYRY